jgi:hypothetical protein
MSRPHDQQLICPCTPMMVCLILTLHALLVRDDLLLLLVLIDQK